MNDVFDVFNVSKTLVEILLKRAERQPDAIAYRYLSHEVDETRVVTLTYAELLGQAAAVARALGPKARGERILLIYPPGIAFVPAFYGCLLAGAAAVPVYPPDPARMQSTVGRLRQIAKDAAASQVCSLGAIGKMLPLLADEAPELARLPWIATDTLPQSESWSHDGPAPEDLGLLQYTSGSTSLPKGVMVSHANLMHNQRQIQASWQTDADTHLVGWLPLVHDMGLIGNVMHPMALGSSCTLMSPYDFLARPIRWLEAISRLDVRIISGGPSFSYGLAARKTKVEEIAALDLSCWEVAYCGAEPIRAHEIESFFARFEPAGFRRSAFLPCYGLAEATLFVTSRPRDAGMRAVQLDAAQLAAGQACDSTDAEATQLVGCGVSSLDGVVRIVDPQTRQRLAPDQVGEIWIRGANVAGGYWGKPDVSAEVFAARTEPDDGHAYLRSGDLGCLCGGELLVTGRIKDLIIVRGRNIYPQDIETTVEAAHRAIKPGCVAAFAWEDESGESVGILAEVVRPDQVDLDQVQSAVRSAVAVHQGVELRWCGMVVPHTVPKTTSGKLQRQRCRDWALNGKVDLLIDPLLCQKAVSPEAPSPTDEKAPRASEQEALTASSDAALTAWMRQTVAALAAIPAQKVDINQPFAELGLGSVQLVELISATSEKLGRSIDVTLAFSHPTVASLVAAVCVEGSSTLSPETSVDTAATPKNGPLAIVALGCRLPGDVQSPEQLWALLRDERNAIEPMPTSRFSAADLERFDFTLAGQQCGGFVHDLERFDAPFFGLSPREAESLDPQGRLLLETTWRAIESWGREAGVLHGSRTGVFVGLSGNEYRSHAIASPDKIDGYVALGNSHSAMVGRLSYLLGLRGPNVALDTACSSSLAALHIAARSIRQGECDQALVGGVNVLLGPEAFAALQRFNVLSPNGRCAAFSNQADGYVRAEGCVVLLVRRLADAQRDGDRIMAVLRGSAMNQDGASNGLSAPNPVAQVEVIEAAVRDAGLDAADVDAVECHGTGTALGDPIEVGALSQVYGRGRASDRPLWIGSIKSNMGHAEPAAGLAGVAKAVLALQHEQLPCSLHVETENEHVPWSDLPVRVLRESRPWLRNGHPRCIGVSSFGFSGTNVHAIFEEAPSVEPAPLTAQPIAEQPQAMPLLLSGSSEAALRAQAAVWSEWLATASADDWLARLRGAATRRTHLTVRAAVCADDPTTARAALTALAQDVPHPALVIGRAQPRSGPVFVFPGQGGQWREMAQSLLQQSRVFGDAIAECDAVLRPHTGWSLAALLRGETNETLPAWNRVDAIQIEMFAVSVALARLWASLGVVPACVVGQSQGEIAAAVVAGALSLEDGARLIALRAQHIHAHAPAGAMAVTGLPASEVERRLLETDGLWVALVSTESSTVVGGRVERVEAWIAEMEREGTFCRRVDADYASHTPMMAEMLPELAAMFADLSPRATHVPMVSSVTGRLVEGAQLDAYYWCQNLGTPVRFDRASTTLLELGFDTFLEVNCHPIHDAVLHEVTAGRDCVIARTLKKGEGELSHVYRALATLHVAGIDVDWSGLLGRTPVVEPPPYAFTRQCLWMGRPEPLAVQSTTDKPFWDAVEAADLGALRDVLSLPGDKDVALRTLLPYLRRLRADDAARDKIAGQLFDEQWVPEATSSESVGSRSQARTRAWLVSDDPATDPWIEHLSRLAQAGGQTVQVLSTETATMTARTLQDTAAPDLLLYVAGIDDLTGDEPHSVSTRSSWAVHEFAAAVFGNPALAATRLWLLTPHALSTDASDAPETPVLHALWGLGRSYALENAQRMGGLVDLPGLQPSSDPAENAGLLDCLSRLPDAAEEFAVRNGRLLVRRLVAAAPTDAALRPWQPQDTTLITGGTGWLGVELARWLVRRGATHLVFASRRGAQAKVAATLSDELQAQGCLVRFVACDVSDSDAVDRLVKSLAQPAKGWPTLRNVFHLAGKRDATADLSGAAAEEDWQQVIAVKTDAAWALHEACCRHHVELDQMVLYGSLAGWFGSGNQPAYAAANAGLAGLAQHRQTLGLPTTVVHWGPWAEGGMVSADDVDQLARLGVTPLAPPHAHGALGWLLAERWHGAAIAHLDVRRLAAGYRALRSSDLFEQMESSVFVENTPEVDGDSWVQRLEMVPQAERREWVCDLVRREAAAVLRLGDQADLPIGKSLRDCGLDSLMAIELLNALGKRTGLRLPPALMLKLPSVSTIADDILRLADAGAQREVDGEDFERDSVLPAELMPPQRKHEARAPLRRVLLTGATGFLGGYMLAELLAEPEIEIWVLVRAKDPAAGLARVRNNLDHYRLATEGLDERVHVLCGDLSAPLLGLDRKAYDGLATGVDAIIHSGAQVNWVCDYDDLRAANVVGTAAIIELACVRGTPLHYISSLGVFRKLGEERNENAEPDDPSTLRYGYVQTKAVAERLVQQAAQRGLPASIHRPGQITGDFESGVTPRDDFMAMLFGGIVGAGCAPQELVDSAGIPISPVHWTANAIVRLILSGAEGNYHLTVPDLSFEKQIDLLRARGHRIELRPYEEWLAALDSQRRANIRNPLHALREWFPDDYNEVRLEKGVQAVKAKETLGQAIETRREHPAFESFLDFLEEESLLPNTETTIAKKDT